MLFMIPLNTKTPKSCFEQHFPNALLQQIYCTPIILVSQGNKVNWSLLTKGVIIKPVKKELVLMKQKHPPIMETYGEYQVSAFGLELLRTVLIPEILGDETPSILYWSGRKLARLYPLQELSDLPLFFERAGWGTLGIKEEQKDKCWLTLSSELIEARLKVDETPVFSLEAGFLAEQFEQIKGFTTETFTEPKPNRHKKIEFQVKWDLKDPVLKD
jgi:predicted hydrocarbon binding protein